MPPEDRDQAPNVRPGAPAVVSLQWSKMTEELLVVKWRGYECYFSCFARRSVAEAADRFQSCRLAGRVWGIGLKGAAHTFVAANMERQQSDLERDRQYCELCGKMENLLKCGRCRSSFYCSKEHQKQHWKKHKLICKEAEKAQLPSQTPEQQAHEPPPPLPPQPPPPPPPPPQVDNEEPEKPPEKRSPEPADSASLPESANAEAPGVADKPAEDVSNNTATPNGQTSASPQKLSLEYIVPCMNKHGICVVDNFLCAETGLGILENVKALHKTGRFTDGQLVSQKSDSTKDIRGDKITWIEGREAGCEKIRFLMSRMDDLIRHCNGKLGNYTINGRTKVSMAAGGNHTNQQSDICVQTPECFSCFEVKWSTLIVSVEPAALYLPHYLVL